MKFFSGQVRSSEGRFVEDGPLQVCSAEIGITQVCFSQVRSLQIGLSKIGPVEINSVEINAMKISSVEVRLDSLDISICSSPVIPKCFS